MAFSADLTRLCERCQVTREVQEWMLEVGVRGVEDFGVLASKEDLVMENIVEAALNGPKKVDSAKVSSFLAKQESKAIRVSRDRRCLNELVVVQPVSGLSEDTSGTPCTCAVCGRSPGAAAESDGMVFEDGPDPFVCTVCGQPNLALELGPSQAIIGSTTCEFCGLRTRDCADCEICNKMFCAAPLSSRPCGASAEHGQRC